MSAKNTLQELLVKRKLAFPTYSTKRVGGPDNAPLFVSTVTFDEKSFTGDKHPNKTSAEISAATKALSFLEVNSTFTTKQTSFTSIAKKKIVVKPKTYLCVDMENIPYTKVEEVLEISGKNLDILGFATKSHPSSKDESKCKKVIVRSSQKDACDLAIALMIGGILSGNLHIETPFYIIIVTKDHFGKAIEEIVEAEYMNPRGSAHVQHVIDVDELYDVLVKNNS